jgi:multiple sugar transport system ATP-binding protein
MGALLDSGACSQLGQPCRLTVDEKHIHIFDKETERTLIRHALQA